jgi:hypothetical protein
MEYMLFQQKSTFTKWLSSFFQAKVQSIKNEWFGEKLFTKGTAMTPR